MRLIIIIAAIWGISALISHARQARIAREQQRQREEQARIRAEQMEQRRQHNEMVTAQIALEREQMKQRREQERLAKEQRDAEAKAEREREKQMKLWEKQRKEDAARDAKIAKHDEDIRNLNQTVSRLSAKVEDIDLRIINLESVKEINYKKFLEADHAGDDTNKEKYLRKLITIDNQLSAARDSRQAMLDKIENAQRKISA